MGLFWARERLMVLRRYALPAAFVVALMATTSSLYLSEVAGWTPCKLCWYQRVFMYPQMVLLGVAWIYRSVDVKKYAIALGSIGAVISLYHYYLQRLAASSGCSLNGGVDCLTKYTFHYGYITIPVMAATAFILIIVAMLTVTSPCRSPS